MTGSKIMMMNNYKLFIIIICIFIYNQTLAVSLDLSGNSSLILEANFPYDENFPSIEQQIKNQLIDNNDFNAIKYIEFHNFDTLPNEAEVFQNIECILFKNSVFEIPTAIFPKLNSVIINIDMGINAEIFSNKSWLKKVKILSVSKTTDNTFTSFKQIPNLEELYLYETNFGVFPSDINTLKRLRALSIVNYGNELNLNKINLLAFPYLQKVHFECFYDNWSKRIIKGIPKGIRKLQNNVSIEIDHPNLTQKEKRIISNYKNGK